MSTRRQFLQILGLGLVGAMVGACSDNTVATKLPSGSLVVALGDSLTFGYGTQPNHAYPTVLASLTHWQIDNAGVNGDTTQNVLDRLPMVIEKQPKLVLLGIGGNDVLRRVPVQTTKDNLLSIVNQLKSANIPVVLIAEPHFSASALFGKASDNPVYKEVAEQTDVPLFENGWSQILSDDSLKSDQIHANTAGYQKFAELLFEFLKELGYV